MKNPGRLDRPGIASLGKPRLERVQQRGSQPVPVVGIGLDEATHRRTGHDAHVPGVGALVLLIGHQRVYLAIHHQRDVPGLPAAKVFLQENSLGIIHTLKPGTRVPGGFADDRVHRAVRRAKRVLDDEGFRLAIDDLQGVNPVVRHVRGRKRHPVSAAEFPGEIPVALDQHRLAGGGKQIRRAVEQRLRPRRLCPVDGHRDDEVDPLSLDQPRQ